MSFANGYGEKDRIFKLYNVRMKCVQIYIVVFVQPLNMIFNFKYDSTRENALELELFLCESKFL
jgi:hypothetical protein